MDNLVSSTTPCEMGDISDLELPALLEDDGNVDKAEACRKQLEDVSKSANALLLPLPNLLLVQISSGGSHFEFVMCLIHSTF
jgi:hypothetical protein